MTGNQIAAVTATGKNSHTLSATGAYALVRRAEVRAPLKRNRVRCDAAPELTA
jgi:hypothetical protein